MSLRVVGIAGSVSPGSRSRVLVARTLSHLASRGGATALIDLRELPAEALLGRRSDPAVDQALADAAGAHALVVGTPIYRATYTGQLKAFFDLFPQDALRGRAVGLIATGQAEGHYLALDHGLRPLVASLGGISAPHGVYVTNARFPDVSEIPEPVDQELRALADELESLAGALLATRVG